MPGKRSDSLTDSCWAHILNCCYLRSRVEYAARKFEPPRSFDGWATLRVEKLTELPIERAKYEASVIASPITKENSSDLNDPEVNIYHAHILRPKDVDHYGMALHLRYLFEQYSDIKTFEKNIESQPNELDKDTPLKVWLVTKLEAVKKFFRL
jgi:hypothetical protein